MRRISAITGFLVVVAFASVANAQCLTCIQESAAGYCGWAAGSFCSRQCCAASWGDPCTLPDFFDSCYGARPGTFQFAMFENRMPQPTMLPTCAMKTLMDQGRRAKLPRRAAA